MSSCPPWIAVIPALVTLRKRDFFLCVMNCNISHPAAVGDVLFQIEKSLPFF